METDPEKVTIAFVNDMAPIRATELVTRVIAYRFEHGLPHAFSENLPTLFDRLVAEGKIFKLEYVFSDSPYRLRSVYFPIDVTLYSHGGGDTMTFESKNKAIATLEAQIDRIQREFESIEADRQANCNHISDNVLYLGHCRLCGLRIGE